MPKGLFCSKHLSKVGLPSYFHQSSLSAQGRAMHISNLVNKHLRDGFKSPVTILRSKSHASFLDIQEGSKSFQMKKSLLITFSTLFPMLHWKWIANEYTNFRMLNLELFFWSRGTAKANSLPMLWEEQRDGLHCNTEVAGSAPRRTRSWNFHQQGVRWWCAG